MPRAYIPVEVRRMVIERAQERCEYCQSRADFTTETFAIEHVVPLSRGGTDDIDNLALACSGCNSRKYNKTEVYDLISNQMVRLFNPRLQLWNKHFVWGESYTQLVGVTDIGRATVDALQMNRPSVQNIRKAMLLMGIHPPK
jgi:hypothetical protein